MSQPIRGQGGHLVFPIGPKNTNLVEDVEILLPVRFRWILFSGFRGEVENVKVYAGRTTDDGRTDDGRCAMTIAHLSLRLRWAKNIEYQSLMQVNSGNHNRTFFNSLKPPPPWIFFFFPYKEWNSLNECQDSNACWRTAKITPLCTD